MTFAVASSLQFSTLLIKSAEEFVTDFAASQFIAFALFVLVSIICHGLLNDGSDKK